MFKKNKKMKIAVICIVAALSITAFAGATSANENGNIAEEVKKDILVDTITPKIGNIVVTGEYIGVTEPAQQVTVYPKASGEVLSVNFNVGDAVQAGDVLFELDSKALQTSISQTQAAVASAQAKARQNLAIAQNNLATQDYNVEYGYDNTLKTASNAIDNAQTALDNAMNRLQSAEASLQAARRQLREFRDDNIYPASMLTLQGMGYDDQVEAQLQDAVKQAQIAVEAADIGVDQAKSNLDKAKEGYKTAEIMVQEQRISIHNQVEIAKLNTNLNDQYIAIQKLQNDLDNYTVTAPIGGIIENRSIEPYHMASPQAPAFVISDKDSMTVSFKVSKASYAHMKIGDKVTLENNGSTHTGTITEISTMVDSNGLFAINANVPNPPADLYTGASVKILAEAQRVENAVLIPLSAVYYENGEAYVYIAENGLAKKVFVDVGIYDEQNIQIVSGVNALDRIINTWSARLADGVEIVLASEVNNEDSAEAADVLDGDNDDPELTGSVSDEKERASLPEVSEGNSK